MRTAIITGITGQDGAYLARHLLGLGYKVVGAYRRTSSTNFWRINELGLARHKHLQLTEHDLTDFSSSLRLLREHPAQEVYNLAAQSFVAASFTHPLSTAEVNGIGPLNLLEAIRLTDPSIRFYQASTSEMFGKVQSVPQDERTAFWPRSPYGVSKVFAHATTVNYREAYGIYACSGILFNHESPLRGLDFVTRKITHAIARIRLGKQEHVELGNLDARRDWGFAGDYVIGMHAMLQAALPDDYVLATGVAKTVREFATCAFSAAHIPIEWEGAGENEVGRDAQGVIRVQINAAYRRPAEVDLLVGSPAKALAALHWKAQTSFSELCADMVTADLRRVEAGDVQ